MVLASRGTAVLSRQSAAFIYVLAYATWTGSNLWTTFIAGVLPQLICVQQQKATQCAVTLAGLAW